MELAVGLLLQQSSRGLDTRDRLVFPRCVFDLRVEVLELLKFGERGFFYAR